ncbi:MAG TPA: amino acid ABC transporter substrate-binding protein [Candidatus Scatomonas merdavium]|nr:amino acid ABC transporter substrate-binding protein [Candidatus Scatomonas merdavium]
MKKKIISCLLAAMTAAALAGCGSGNTSSGSSTASSAGAESASSGSSAESSSSSTSAESASSAASSSAETGDVPEGLEDGVLTVGFDAEYPPYGYMGEDGEYTGFDLELAQAVCDLEGWELEKKPIAWDSKDMELESGSIDCIWNGFTMTGRESEYTFSVPYVDNSQVIVVSESSGIETFEDLAGKTVGVQAASAALEVLQDEEGQKALADTFASLNEFADYNTAFTELQAGALDALAIDIGVAKYQLESRGEGFKMLDETLNSEEYAIAFKLGNESLRDAIDEDLQTLTDDGTVQELAEKYGIADMLILGAE